MSAAQQMLCASQVAAFAGPDHYRDSEAVADVIRETLDALSLPAAFVQPGDRVVLKPNWIKQHDERFPGPDQWEQVVTHPSVIEAVARWAAREPLTKERI